jgi:hypothetical protein
MVKESTEGTPGMHLPLERSKMGRRVGLGRAWIAD